MKKIILIIAIIASTTAYAQEPCTSCSNTQTDGVNASAIGYGTKANGNYSFASGYLSEALGVRSTALGTNAMANTMESIAIGSFVNANGDGSFAIGRLVETGTLATQSMIIGMGVDQNIKLVNNLPNSLMIGFNSTKPTLFISPSPTNAAYTLTGRVGIGNITAPQAKLHIKADAGEAATVFIEPNKWDLHAQANLLLGNMNHGITADGTAGLVFHTQSAYIFNEGNVGIGTVGNLPETKLDVNGTVKMTGLRLFDQTVHTGYVLTCSGINGQAIWQNPDAFSTWTVNGAGDIYRMSKVGILTSEPKAELDVNGNIGVNDAVVGKITTVRGNEWVDPNYLNIVGSTNENASKIMIPKGNDTSALALKIINPALGGEIQFFAGTNPNAVLRINEFIVGFPNHNVDLKVNGKIWSHEVEVKLTDWWDEVLTKDYKLMPLHQLESYIATNKHLPDIPTEKEVLKNGVELGEMNALLLKKVEELTLYVIEQQKRIDRLEKKVGKSN